MREIGCHSSAPPSQVTLKIFISSKMATSDPFPQTFHARKWIVDGLQCFHALIQFSGREAGRYWGKMRNHSPPGKKSVKTGAFRTSGRESCLHFWLLSEDTHAYSRQTSQVSSNQKAPSPQHPSRLQYSLLCFLHLVLWGESSYLSLQGLDESLESTWLSVFAAHRTG